MVCIAIQQAFCASIVYVWFIRIKLFNQTYKLNKLTCHNDLLFIIYVKVHFISLYYINRYDIT